MSSTNTIHRTPKSGRQSMFFQDLATPVTSRKSSGKFATPGQAAAVSALWRENFATTDLPPPPMFTLEDRNDLSPESGISDYPMSPEGRSDPRTPLHGFGREFTTPKTKSEPSTSYHVMGSRQQSQSPVAGLTLWSSPKSGGSAEQEDKGKGSPVDGVVNSGALITLPLPREVARPEMKRNSVPVGRLDEEEWVTVYGFSPVDTNLVLREFEKCGVVLKHVPGGRDANWMHLLYQNRADAHKALSKNGTQINGALIIGVKLLDPMQREALNERAKNQGFMTLPPAPSNQIPEMGSSRSSTHPYYLQNGSASKQTGGTVAAPAKSVVSKLVDYMFGV